MYMLSRMNHLIKMILNITWTPIVITMLMNLMLAMRWRNIYSISDRFQQTSQIQITWVGLTLNLIVFQVKLIIVKMEKSTNNRVSLLIERGKRDIPRRYREGHCALNQTIFQVKIYFLIFAKRRKSPVNYSDLRKEDAMRSGRDTLDQCGIILMYFLHQDTREMRQAQNLLDRIALVYHIRIILMKLTQIVLFSLQ